MSNNADQPRADFLSEDPPLRGQNFVCLSFLSPEDVIVGKDAFAFQRFLDSSFAADIRDLFANLKKRFEGDAPVIDMIDNVESRYDFIRDAGSLDKQFQFWKSQNADSIDAEYNAKVQFRTSVRGIKVRGTYDTFPEAENRCRQIKNFDPMFDVYVAQVGCWCPWSPRPELIDKQEFANEQLNELMQKYVEAQHAKDEFYQTRKENLCARATSSAPASASLDADGTCTKDAIDDARHAMRSVELSDGPDPWMRMRGMT